MSGLARSDIQQYPLGLAQILVELTEEIGEEPTALLDMIGRLP